MIHIYRMVIVGGSGLVLLGVLARATQDIDTIQASPEIRHLLTKYDANMRVSAYSSNFPYNFEDRLVPLEIGGRKICFFTCSLEDIVIAKLYSQRETDRQDIISEDVLRSLDWNKLRYLALDDETKASALNDQRYMDFLYNYEEYVKRYRPDEKTDI